MEKRLLIFSVLSILLYSIYPMFSLSTVTVPENLSGLPTIEYMMQNANMGKTFYIAIPQNDIKSGQREEILGIFITSYTDTKVKLSIPTIGLEKIRDVKAFHPTVFSSENGDATFNWEITESEVIKEEAIILTSDDPISVYVLNSKQSSSDGYTAIPTEAWGKKYVHSAYYDHREPSPSTIRRGAGFIIIAAHEGTNVTINLKGVGGELGTTVAGKKIGESINISLKTGQTYLVRGNGANVGFDLTGTTIEANKPIGVISFHQRTMVPNKSPNGRDHLNEMLLPVESWGTDFVTMAFNRGTQGDFMRVVAYYDDTHIIADQYNAGSGNALADGHIETFLNKGNFWEYLQATCGSNNKQNGVRGVTVWKSNKPIQIMQLAYSYPWDQDTDWDPLMVSIPSLKQFQRSSLLLPPTEGGFITNELTFFAEGDPNDHSRTIYNSLELNNEKLSKKYPQFLYNSITGTNLVWGRFNLDPQVSTLTSKTKISGYITGFSGYNSFGWPAMMGTNKIDELDTLSPVLEIDYSGCGNFSVNATEVRNSSGTNPQTDQGLRNIYLIKEATSNYTLTMDRADNYFPELFVTQQVFHLNIIDVTKDAKAYFLVGDRAGNFIIDSVEYIAAKPTFSSNEIDFGAKRSLKTHTMEFVIKNNGIKQFTLKSINLSKDIRYKILNLDNVTFPITIIPEDSLILTIEFAPIKLNYETDSLLIKTDCMEYSIYIKGTGKNPKVNCENWNFGNYEVGYTLCVEDMNELGIKVSNDGNDTLHITGIKSPIKPFSISDPINPKLPIEIAPLQVVYLKSICFTPMDTGRFSSDVVIECDDLEGDTIISLSGFGFRKVDVFESNLKDFLIVQPNPVNKGEISITFNLVFDSMVKIELFNIEGNLEKLLLNSFEMIGSNQINYDLSQVPSGVYFIKFKTDRSLFIKKLIVNK